MSRTKGSTKTGGRKKGTPNKRTVDTATKLEELKCDPITGMANIAELAMNGGDYHLAAHMYKELAQYIATIISTTD